MLAGMQQQQRAYACKRTDQLAVCSSPDTRACVRRVLVLLCSGAAGRQGR